MCRFTLYPGPAIPLSSLLVDPSHSLIRQSTHSRERDEPLNGDGFGVGWYANELTHEPAVFRSISPAWNNRNLLNLARVVVSDNILAHMRAATNLSGVSESNCHPFRFNEFLYMHNGDIGEFPRLRRRMLGSVGDEAFNNVYGSTDSEYFFALIIDYLMQHPSKPDAAVLGAAIEASIRRLSGIAKDAGASEPSYLNVAISNGRESAICLYATDGHPESLYIYSGRLYPSVNSDSDTLPAITVSSEQLTEDSGWKEVPVNHMVLISGSSAAKIVPISQ